MSTKKPAVKTTAKPAAAKSTKAPAKKAAAPAKGGAAAKGGGAAPAAAAEPKAPKPQPLPVEEIGLKEVNVVLNDTKGLIQKSGRWPLIVDESERVSVFLRHRDCNTVNVLDSREMEPDMIRQALLGAIRFGKPMVVNLAENGGIEIVQDRFNDIMPDLWNLLLSKQILEEDRYMKLVRPTDDAAYTESTLFAVGEHFTFVFLTANATITEDTMSKVIVFKIV